MPYELKIVLAVCGLFNILFVLYPARWSVRRARPPIPCSDAA
jgi:hypothetical protein